MGVDYSTNFILPNKTIFGTPFIQKVDLTTIKTLHDMYHTFKLNFEKIEVTLKMVSKASSFYLDPRTNNHMKSSQK